MTLTSNHYATSAISLMVRNHPRGYLFTSLWLLGSGKTIEVSMWEGTIAVCQYDGEVNPDGEPHGVGTATKCSYRNAEFEGHFMFGVAHGKGKTLSVADLNCRNLHMA